MNTTTTATTTATTTTDAKALIFADFFEIAGHRFGSTHADS